MARQPLSHVIPNLLHDSGPPLYYLLARFDSVIALRWLSLAFAAVQFAIVVRKSLLGALLLAVYPPAVLFSADARSYALCALVVTAAVVVLDDDRPIAAAALFTLAGYTHYYGVLFFPLLLIRKKFVPFAVVCVLFIPGFILAFHQPPQALKWNRESLVAPFANLSFAGMYEYSLFAAAPLALVVIAMLVFAVAGSRSMRFAPAVFVPLALVLALHVAGKPVYFPMRFESVVAGPLVLWLGSSLSAWADMPRRALAAALVAIGAVCVAAGIADHERRPLDPFREAALRLRGANAPIVASGYLYLETLMATGRPVTAWPAEQAVHPGWRADDKPDPRTLPRDPFVWIGEVNAPELATLREVRRLRPLFWNSRTLVARTAALTAPVH